MEKYLFLGTDIGKNKLRFAKRIIFRASFFFLLIMHPLESCKKAGEISPEGDAELKTPSEISKIMVILDAILEKRTPPAVTNSQGTSSLTNLTPEINGISGQEEVVSFRYSNVLVVLAPLIKCFFISKSYNFKTLAFFYIHLSGSILTINYVCDNTTHLKSSIFNHSYRLMFLEIFNL